MDLERNLRRLAAVPRWAVVSTIKQQSVAEHSFHVTWICHWLNERLNTKLDDGELLLLLTTALTHDNDEAVTGDIPSPAKPPNNVQVYTKVKCILKLADILEAMLFVREETQLGNRSMLPIIKDLTKTGDIWVDRARQVGILATPSIAVLFDHLWSKIRPDLHPVLMGDDLQDEFMAGKN